MLRAYIADRNSNRSYAVCIYIYIKFFYGRPYEAIDMALAGKYMLLIRSTRPFHMPQAFPLVHGGGGIAR